MTDKLLTDAEIDEFQQQLFREVNLKPVALDKLTQIFDQTKRANALEAECERLRGEVVNRNQRALDGDKATAAFNAEYERAEQHRIRAEFAERKLAEAEAEVERLRNCYATEVRTAQAYLRRTEQSERKLSETVAALKRIASNTCCDTCREAALVAQEAINEVTK